MTARKEMRLLTLSNHTQDQVSAAAKRRQSEYEAGIESYKQHTQRRTAKSAALRQSAAHARDHRQYLAWLGFQLSRLFHALSPMPNAPRKAQASRDEVVWQAGSDGEQRVIDALSYRLTDDWVAISGYRNPGGEVDLLVVGPPGVMAVEIKYLNGQVHCDGDRWWRDKYDKYGNQVETALPITDRGGRGPSAQVNAAAERLQRFLSERTSIRRVLRAVVFSHEASRLGALQRVNVDAVALAHSFDVPSAFQRALPRGEHLPVDDIVRLIQQDHGFHARRDRKGGAPYVGDASAAQAGLRSPTALRSRRAR